MHECTTPAVDVEPWREVLKGVATSPAHAEQLIRKVEGLRIDVHRQKGGTVHCEAALVAHFRSKKLAGELVSSRPYIRLCVH